MLRCLRIQNLAIIDELELELGLGLNVITGETGAGKSILVGALELVLGSAVVRAGGVVRTGAGKGRAELVRSGAKDGEVEALFEVGRDAAVRRRLEACGLGEGLLPDSEEAELVVRRVVSASGRTRAFINGKLVTLPMLGEIAKGLADISSQHEHHTLSDPNTHLGYLDAFAGSLPLCQRVSRAYHSLLRARASLEEFEARLRDRAVREAQLSAEVAEIEEIAPEPGEDQELERTLTRLRGMDALLRLTAGALEVLYERDDSVVDGLGRATRQLTQAAELAPELLPTCRELEAIRSQLEDVVRDLGRHTGDSRPEPEALQRLEERLHQLSRLKRRYACGLDGVLAELEKYRAELDELRDHTSTSEALTAQQARAFEEAGALARSLSAERVRAAERLSRAISRELDSLGMGGARVLVELTPLAGGAGELVVDGARLGASGLERAEFLIAPNRGEEARPLHRVASGGELSRAMLAIKCVLAELGPAGLYAFDEVDAGVGGGMAEIIGRKIRSVAQHRQVLCITHLPQIAVFADQHFKVEKVVVGERTLSRVRRLGAREQSEEIARMLGGVRITAKTRAVARELLRDARRSDVWTGAPTAA